MQWGKLDEIEPEEKLLYQVLMWIIAPYDNRSVDHYLKEVFGPEKGLGGDPGWEIERVSDEPGGDYFRVWADQYHSGCDHEERRYDNATFIKAVRETLMAYAVRYPQRAAEIGKIITGYGL